MRFTNIFKAGLCLSLLSTSLLLSSCDQDKPKNPEKQYDTSKVIANTIDIVTVRSFEDLTAEVTALDKACMELQKSPTQANLDKARELWKVARKTWEQTEAFGFGPVGELDQDNKISEGEDNYPLDIDPNMDTWPVDVSLMNQTIASNEPITKENFE